MQASSSIDSVELSQQRNKVIDCATKAITKYNKVASQNALFDIDGFIKIKYDISKDLIAIIDQYSKIIGEMSLDAPTITIVNQEDANSVKVCWKTTQKIRNCIEKCKDKNSFKYQLLPMINNGSKTGKNAENLRVLEPIDIKCNENKHIIKISENLIQEFEYKCDEKRDSDLDGLQFQCQMRTINDELNIRSKWGDIFSTKITIVPFEYNCVFTNLNATGRLGPTSFENYYFGQYHENDVKLSNKYQGYQIWTVPKSGWYKIICFGASGGDNTKYNLTGGKGAKVGGLIELKKNDQLQIVVGQTGQSTSNGLGGGGGGGTFVATMDNKPLFVASGGNGACYYKYKVNGINGLAIQSENRNDIKKFGGIESDGSAARGASFKNDFITFKSRKECEKCNGTSFLDGALGGKKYDEYCSDGGFGGGGGSYLEGGGGGGYIGGLVSNQNDKINQYPHFGALSFNIGKKERIMESGVNVGHGKVVISFRKSYTKEKETV